jgi:hypothetical protein
MKQLKHDVPLANLYERVIIREQAEPKGLDYDDKEIDVEGKHFFVKAKFNYKRKAIDHIGSVRGDKDYDVYADVPDELVYLKAYEMVGDDSKEVTDETTTQMLHDYVLDMGRNDRDLYKDEDYTVSVVTAKK